MPVERVGPWVELTASVSLSNQLRFANVLVDVDRIDEILERRPGREKVASDGAAGERASDTGFNDASSGHAVDTSEKRADAGGRVYDALGRNAVAASQ